MKEKKPEVTVTLLEGKFYVNYVKDTDNFGMSAGTDDKEAVLRMVKESLDIIGGQNG